MSQGADKVPVSWTTLSRKNEPHRFISNPTWMAYLSGGPWGRDAVLRRKTESQNRPGCVQLVAYGETPDREVIIEVQSRSWRGL